MRTLLVVYKIEKGKGSEDGSGYSLASALAHRCDLTIITRSNNAELLRHDPNFVNVNIVPLDVPWALSFYKKKGRGIILYYYIWQILVGLVARRLNASDPFDVIHQLNFHADWAPHFLPRESRLIWGPIAHHRRVPSEFMDGVTIHGRALEWLRGFVKAAFWNCDPFIRRAIRCSDVIFYACEDVAPPFLQAEEKIRFSPYAVSNIADQGQDKPRDVFRVLSVGRLVPLKGFSPALEAFAVFQKQNPEIETRFVIIGSGPLERALRSMAKRFGVSEYVDFVPWIDQKDLVTHYVSASVFLFPSFEAQGLVVAEALCQGTPVICLEGTGPSYIAEEAAITVSRFPRAQTVEELSAALSEVWRDFRDVNTNAFDRRVTLARRVHRERLKPERHVDTFLQAYDC